MFQPRKGDPAGRPYGNSTICPKERVRVMATIRPLDRVAHPRVLVVGGGIAGIQAALEVAAVGLPVTLAEAGFSIGGRMAQLDKTFPTNDCAMCILSPRMLEISRHPLITIQTSTQAIEVRGRAGDFQVLLSRRPRFVDVGKCTGCGECVRVCPQSLPDPYNLGLSQTKAIHVPFPQAIPQAAYLTPEACRIFRGKSCEACIKVCPAGAINLQDSGGGMDGVRGGHHPRPGCDPGAGRRVSPGMGIPTW